MNAFADVFALVAVVVGVCCFVNLGVEAVYDVRHFRRDLKHLAAERYADDWEAAHMRNDPAYAQRRRNRDQTI